MITHNLNGCCSKINHMIAHLHIKSTIKNLQTAYDCYLKKQNLQNLLPVS